MTYLSKVPLRDPTYICIHILRYKQTLPPKDTATQTKPYPIVLFVYSTLTPNTFLPQTYQQFFLLGKPLEYKSFLYS